MRLAHHVVHRPITTKWIAYLWKNFVIKIGTNSLPQRISSFQVQEVLVFSRLLHPPFCYPPNGKGHQNNLVAFPPRSHSSSSFFRTVSYFKYVFVWPCNFVKLVLILIFVITRQTKPFLEKKLKPVESLKTILHMRRRWLWLIIQEEHPKLSAFHRCVSWSRTERGR